MRDIIRVGVDIGSTTIKMVAINGEGKIIFHRYLRHFSNVVATLKDVVEEAQHALPTRLLSIAFTGSAGMGLSECTGLGFIQEVVACTKAVKKIIPQADTVIELGGEDAKITYFGDSMEQRMNGVCAGGTGAFIDQMAVLLDTDPGGLNELAKNYKMIYPIASRCGVFAKTDIQNLMNEGATKEDIAASIFQAVVDQTIGSLAQGRPIKGKVAFLGGPLHFLSELRQRFIETLKLSEEQIVAPDGSQYFVALGAAMSTGEEEQSMDCLVEPNLAGLRAGSGFLDPLFADEAEYEDFKQRHARAQVEKGDITSYTGRVFLGIDAGSTTTKLALVGEGGELLYSYYTSNRGKPLESVIEGLQELYGKLPAAACIAGTTATGYGENLVKAALKADFGEVETVAHLKAAQHFLPGVSFVLDIGGQDMKSFFVKDGIIDSIMLNEACSSGCGSFIETFAQSNGLPVGQFASLAATARQPVDLGTRCTVFINSKVKQVQKEGASIEDISAGLAISVVKNTLFKVIRLKDVAELGDNIIVQGGTFKNDAVLRALEKITGVNVIRPDIAGLMGAYGAALLSRERAVTGMSSRLAGMDELDAFSIGTTSHRCGLCSNNCRITTKRFSNGEEYSSGNRCERGVGAVKPTGDLPDMYAYKYKRLFGYTPRRWENSRRGAIGLPRALNMYEDYPFWFTFFSELGYRVVLSDPTADDTYKNGMDTIASETVCYPAKLMHGHITNLIQKGVKKIFYPSIPFNTREQESSDNCFNCPVVASYPESIDANMDTLREGGVVFYHPFLPLHHPARLLARLAEELESEGISRWDMKRALKLAYQELETYQKDIKAQGQMAIERIKKENLRAVVLAGRPYHIDPKINHGLPELLKNYGFAVLSEDAVAHLAEPPGPLRVVDQWMYHSRLYWAASFAAREKNVELLQISSFGCGLDAVTGDQVKEILEASGKMYTCVKVDEINNSGSVRIRVRSLLAAVREREEQKKTVQWKRYYYKKTPFSKEMAKRHTLLAPQLSPVHFQFMEGCFARAGYRLCIPETDEQGAIAEGLKYIHNDACYPCIIVAGQLIGALKSGRYDPENCSLLLAQTCGGCRATNYIPLIRKALTDAGFGHVPVLSLWGEKSAGFSMSFTLLKDMVMAILYGDLLMQLTYRTRPYEKTPGSVDELAALWSERCRAGGTSRKVFRENVRGMVAAFDAIELDESVVKPKVGVVGEILVKYHPLANNDIVGTLEKEGAEVVVPDMLSFFQYLAYDNIASYDLLAGSLTHKLVARGFIGVLEFLRKDIREALAASSRFQPPHNIDEVAALAKKHLSLANMTGEGWLLTGEMAALLESGVNNIVCLQPFGCLPNHIMGKGMIKKLRAAYPEANIVPLDFDPGISKVNQLNRIKLMLA